MLRSSREPLPFDFRSLEIFIAVAHAGSFTIVERHIAGNGVVFYAKGMGPLLLKRCGFAYLPDGPGASDRFEHIDDEWYLYCL